MLSFLLEFLFANALTSKNVQYDKKKHTINYNKIKQIITTANKTMTKLNKQETEM